MTMPIVATTCSMRGALGGGAKQERVQAQNGAAARWQWYRIGPGPGQIHLHRSGAGLKQLPFLSFG
jgi:hypothetical protein